MLTVESLNRLINAMDNCPWGAASGRSNHPWVAPAKLFRPLYTDAERRRRDASKWTIVQGVLAPVQFIIFLVSVSLVLNFLATGTGQSQAIFSVIVKTLILYTIMVTGSIWEHEIFGRYLFAPAFFWEDVVSMLVLALHTLYLAAVFAGTVGAHTLMLIALAAYASYIVNATQFVLKLRAARRHNGQQISASGGYGCAPAGTAS
jgi:3-vinyl bacteriochlorophyllide hydratase